MRTIGIVVRLLLFTAIVLGVFRNYFGRTQATVVAGPGNRLDTSGVQKDLISIAKAEGLYRHLHGSCVSLDDLIASGAALSKSGRGGYTYDVLIFENNFDVTASCPVDTNPGCANYSVDDTLQVQVAPQ